MLLSRIRRGELDREVTFIKKELSIGDANGDHVDAWVVVDEDPTVAARKRDLSGQDVVTDGQIQYAQRTEWIVDYRDDLTTDNRLVYNGSVFAILAITEHEMGRNRYLVVMTAQLGAETWTSD